MVPTPHEQRRPPNVGGNGQGAVRAAHDHRQRPARPLQPRLGPVARKGVGLAVESFGRGEQRLVGPGAVGPSPANRLQRIGAVRLARLGEFGLGPGVVRRVDVPPVLGDQVGNESLVDQRPTRNRHVQRAEPRHAGRRADLHIHQIFLAEPVGQVVGDRQRRGEVATGCVGLGAAEQVVASLLQALGVAVGLGEHRQHPFIAVGAVPDGYVRAIQHPVQFHRRRNGQLVGRALAAAQVLQRRCVSARVHRRHRSAIQQLRAARRGRRDQLRIDLATDRLVTDVGRHAGGVGGDDSAVSGNQIAQDDPRARKLERRQVLRRQPVAGQVQPDQFASPAQQRRRGRHDRAAVNAGVARIIAGDAAGIDGEQRLAALIDRQHPQAVATEQHAAVVQGGQVVLVVASGSPSQAAVFTGKTQRLRAVGGQTDHAVTQHEHGVDRHRQRPLRP